MTFLKRINFVRLLEWVCLITIVFVFAFPFFWMLVSSVKSFGEVIQYPPTLLPEVFHWDNYTKAWNSGPFLQYTFNSIIVAVSVVLLQLITIIPAAYAYARYEFRGKNLFWGLTLVTLMIPQQLIFLPVYIQVVDAGLLNTLWPLILPFGSSAFGIFMLRQAYKQIPDEILEAARLDKASEFTIMRKIMLPAVRPTIVTLGMLTFISRWNDYFWPLVMTTTDEARTLPIGVTSLRISETVPEWNVVMAANVLLVLPILIIYIFAQKQIIDAFKLN